LVNCFEFFRFARTLGDHSMKTYNAWLTRLLFCPGASSFGGGQRRRSQSRLQIEILEGRCVPSTITPTTFADGGLGSGSLRDAVLQFDADTETDDDIIQLEAGTYSLTIRNVGGQHETAGLTGDLNLTQTSHRWIIQGAGAATIIDASQLQDRAFQIVNPDTQVVFQELVIQGGLAQDDGSDGAMAGTTDALGGGILNNGGDITLAGVALQNNVAQGGNGTHSGHVAGYSVRGGGLYSTGRSVTISDSMIASNQVIARNGVDGYVSNAGSGGAGAGGGIYSTGEFLAIADSTITNNRAIGGRGGNALYGAGSGGAGAGGGVYSTGGSLTIADSAITSNQAMGGHGGSVDCSCSRIGGPGGVSQGGGLYLGGGMLTLANSTISTNALQGGAGGNAYVFGHLNYQGGDGGPGQGGGLWVAAGAAAQVSLSTIATNQAAGGMHGDLGGRDGPAMGGGANNQGMLQTRDTILAGNTAGGPGTNSGPDLAGDLGSLGHNLIANSDGGIGFDPSDLLNVDPRLGSLQDNGGPTLTMAQLPGSPALNTGDPDQLGVPDQRGVVRTGGVNIGAYQASASAFVLSAPDTVQSGVPFDVTVTAVDSFGQVAVGYTGTVTFSSSDADPGVVLPADYTFNLATLARSRSRPASP
jgi:hypothetical protein